MSETAIALPPQIRKTALAYPDKVKTALATLATTGEALELLRAGDGWMQLAKDYGADTVAVNAIQRGRLMIQAKLGELMPHGGKGGRGKKKPVKEGYQFSKPTIARFRKVSAAIDKIDAYHEASTGEGDPVEMSTGGFIDYVVSGKVHVGKNTQATNPQGTKPMQKITCQFCLQPEAVLSVAGERSSQYTCHHCGEAFELDHPPISFKTQAKPQPSALPLRISKGGGGGFNLWSSPVC